MCFFSRQWRDVGEKPSLWAKLQLYFGPGDLEDGDGDEDGDEVEDEDVGPALHQVLTLRRLQDLQSLHLCCWDETQLTLETVHLLQTVVGCCPKLRKIALEFEFIPVSEEELTGVAEVLVKFEEIDLTQGFILKGKERTKDYLRAILTALPGEGSKLKILTLHGNKRNLSADLAEARGVGLKVKVEPVFDGDTDTDSD